MVLIKYTTWLLGLLAPGTGLVLVVIDLCLGQWSWYHPVIFAVSYIIIASGITVGYHRYGTHASFDFSAVGKWVARPLFLIAGSWALQYTFRWWSTIHHQHHLDPDGPHDPHSPYCPDASAWKKMYQFFHSYMLWIPRVKPDFEAFNRKPPFDWFEKTISYLYLLVGPLAAMTLFYLIGGWRGTAWYLAAVCVFWHMTAMVNSVAHTWGERPFHPGDTSGNLWWLAFFTFGEGFHNNHHDKQKSARFARTRWQLLADIGWWEIWAMLKLGLVSRVQVAPLS